MAAPKNLCCVSVGYTHFLMQTEDGMKLMDLMQKAMQCRRSYGDHGYEYEPEEITDLSLEIVRPGQVDLPEAPVSASKPRQKRIGN